MASPYHRNRRIGSLLAATALTVALAGCAMIPPEPANLPEPASAQNLGADKTLASAQADWPSDRWWEGFSDSQLISLIEEGLAGATEIRVAEARFAQAATLVHQARSRLLPTAGATGEAGATKQSYNYIVPEAAVPRGWNSYGQTTVNLTWDVDFWGRNRAALAAARSDAEAAEVEAAATRLAVSTGIAVAYADLANLYAERDAAADAVRVRTSTLELMQDREVQGLENMGAVSRARSALATARGDLLALDEVIMLSRHRIAALLGAGPDRGLSIARPTAQVLEAHDLPTNLPAELVGRRPDIIAARLRAEAAMSRIKGARAAFYPNVSLTGLVGLQALGLDDVFTSGSEFGSVGPAVSLPLFDGGRLKAQYRASEATYAAAVAQYDGALVQALREVADAATSKHTLDHRLDQAAQAAEAAEAAWTVANNRYYGGLATYLDVLAAEDALIATRRTVSTLQTRAFALDIALIRALGGGFNS